MKKLTVEECERISISTIVRKQIHHVLKLIPDVSLEELNAIIAQRLDNINYQSIINGDSLKLSYLAAQTDADYLVFCGVHFMAEVADILSSPQQVAILPDLAAGCSMADMASLSKVERAWRELATVLISEETITPITYINSAADLKAFCGEHGGIVCTSSNATKILQWAFKQRGKVLFFPDQHLGRWSGHQLDIPEKKMAVCNRYLHLVQAQVFRPCRLRQR